LITPGKEVLTLVIIGGVTWTFDPLLTVITMVVVLFMSCFTVFFSPRFKQLSRQGREAESRLMSFVHQTLTAIPIVQAFGTEDQNLQQFDDLAEDVVATSQRGSLLSNTYSILNGLVTTIGTSFIIFVVGQRVLLGTLSIGSFLLFLSYMRTQLGGFRSLLNTYSDLKKTEARIDRVFEVLEEEEEVPDDPNALSLPISTTGINGHIRLENVTFGYEVNRPVLKDITLEAHPDETVALVGSTGAGKSTLVSLIPRFFDPWEGQVLFDGIDMCKIKLASLRAQISLVLQEPFLLPLSVAENISYGRPEATREEIVEAAVAAGADGFIQQLSQGYDTVIGERGATLSGGEKQRLSIARALLKDAPILILDEPTSALDAKTEADLLAALERLMAGRTTFIIAHRLSTIRNADRIVVLDDGRIVEEGTHQELIDKQGLYNKFYDMQFSESSEKVVL
jgi:ATP-binding cassette subfamily B protein/subfamily B ATP-binding cassette protein MsbA